MISQTQINGRTFSEARCCGPWTHDLSPPPSPVEKQHVFCLTFFLPLAFKEEWRCCLTADETKLLLFPVSYSPHHLQKKYKKKSPFTEQLTCKVCDVHQVCWVNQLSTLRKEGLRGLWLSHLRLRCTSQRSHTLLV